MRLKRHKLGPDPTFIRNVDPVTVTDLKFPGGRLRWGVYAQVFSGPITIRDAIKKIELLWCLPKTIYAYDSSDLNSWKPKFVRGHQVTFLTPLLMTEVIDHGRSVELRGAPA